MAQENKPTPVGFKHIVRVANTDLDGNKKTMYALRKVRGISYSISSALCKLTKIEPNKKIGELKAEEVAKLNEMVKDFGASGAPAWLVNHRKDTNSGQDLHVVSTALHLMLQADIKRMMDMRSYKGVRHMFKAPVRGQRTRSNFRPNKGKGMGVKLQRGARKRGRV